MAETVAFGYFINKSNNSGLDYLGKVLPNSFASVLRNKTDLSVIKPEKLDFLNNEKSVYYGREIEEKELLKLSDSISADYFVYGSYEPIADNKIRLNIRVYRTNTNRVFSFIEEGRLEAAIFKLVDRIGYRIAQIASDSMLYKSDTLEKNSRIGIISNIEGEELNILYYELMKSGYKISYIQGNELYTHLDSEQIKKINTITTVNADYNIISDRAQIDLPYGTWSGTKYYKKIIQERDTFNKYAFNFNKTWDDYLKKIKKFNESPFDYFMIIGFDEDKESAWIRCVSFKNNRLIVSQSSIKGKSVEEISQKIVNAISGSLPEKF